MPKRIKIILLFAGLMLLLPECSTLMIPANYRYTAHQLKRGITGSWIHIKMNLRADTTQETEFSGELIAIQSDTMYIVTPDGLKEVRVSGIAEAVLYMYMNQPGMYASVTGLLYLPDIIAALVIGTPGFLLLGIPWVVTGGIVTIAEGSNHTNILTYPHFCTLGELNKFARFPKGMPQAIDKTRIHLLKGD
jgi:hypothetical protein